MENITFALQNIYKFNGEYHPSGRPQFPRRLPRPDRGLRQLLSLEVTKNTPTNQGCQRVYFQTKKP
jgi:hypothetical protein